MKVQILQENLNKGLQIALRSISGRAQLPILSHVLLTAVNNRLKISATNLETGISLWLGGKIEEEGAITVPAKIMAEVIASLPAGRVDLQVEANTLKIVAAGFEAGICGISAAEFPKLPEYSKATLFSLPAEKLAQAVNQVAFAAAVDDGRPVLTGVLFQLNEKNLSLVATDGYRLSLKTIAVDSPVKEEVKLLLPAKALQEIAKIISEEKSPLIQMGFTREQNQVVFAFPDLELFSRVIEGDFPDYEKIIPKTSATKIILDKDNLNRAIRVVSIFARDSANVVRFKFEGNELQMSANSPQIGENTNLLEAKIEGEGGEIAFNFRFVQGFLGAVAGEEVSLEMADSLSPGTFSEAGDASFLHVIMPVRLQNE